MNAPQTGTFIRRSRNVTRAGATGRAQRAMQENLQVQELPEAYRSPPGEPGPRPATGGTLDWKRGRGRDVGTRDARSEAQLLAGILLEHVEPIAERSVTRMQELIPSYARVARENLVPVTRANTRNLLEAIRDPDRAQDQERRDYLVSGAVR